MDYICTCGHTVEDHDDYDDAVAPCINTGRYGYADPLCACAGFVGDPKGTAENEAALTARDARKKAMQ